MSLPGHQRVPAREHLPLWARQTGPVNRSKKLFFFEDQRQHNRFAFISAGEVFSVLHDLWLSRSASPLDCVQPNACSNVSVRFAGKWLIRSGMNLFDDLSGGVVNPFDVVGDLVVLVRGYRQRSWACVGNPHSK